MTGALMIVRMRYLPNLGQCWPDSISLEDPLYHDKTEFIEFIKTLLIYQPGDRITIKDF